MQQAPYCVQIELTLGCNLACSFCGINNVEIPTRKFMTVATARTVAKRIADAGWNSRIEFARRGEPSLNPDMVAIMQAFREQLPKASMLMLTNGAGFIKQPITNVLDVLRGGLNTLGVEGYEAVNYAQRISAALAKSSIDTMRYPENKEGNPHKRYHGKRVVFIADLGSATHGTHSKPNNHGGYAGPLVDYNRPCSKPFRELSVNWDGTVNHCCIAWAGEMVCGNAVHTPLEDIWNNERFFAVRQKLLIGERDFGTCKGCDHPTYRPGLLPDQLGKRKDMYPPPTQQTEAVLREMEAEGTQIEQTQLYKERNA